MRTPEQEQIVADALRELAARAPEPAPRRLHPAGECREAHVFYCATCNATYVDVARRGGQTKAEGEAGARGMGWSKSGKLGWICPACKPVKGGKR